MRNNLALLTVAMSYHNLYLKDLEIKNGDLELFHNSQIEFDRQSLEWLSANAGASNIFGNTGHGSIVENARHSQRLRNLRTTASLTLSQQQYGIPVVGIQNNLIKHHTPFSKFNWFIPAAAIFGTTFVLKNLFNNSFKQNVWVQKDRERGIYFTQDWEIIKEATKWCPELDAACQVWKDIKLDFETIDTL